MELTLLHLLMVHKVSDSGCSEIQVFPSASYPVKAQPHHKNKKLQILFSWFYRPKIFIASFLSSQLYCNLLRFSMAELDADLWYFQHVITKAAKIVTTGFLDCWEHHHFMHLASPNAHLKAINQQCYLAAFSLHFICTEQLDLAHPHFGRVGNWGMNISFTDERPGKENDLLQIFLHTGCLHWKYILKCCLHQYHTATNLNISMKVQRILHNKTSKLTK